MKLDELKTKIALGEVEPLDESSLTRVWQHAKGKAPFAIITAFRGNLTHKNNISRNKALAADIRNKGYGFFYLEGHWVENKDTPDERTVKETSIFAIGDKDKDVQFLKDIVAFGKEYDQDGVLVKTEAGVKIYDKAGKVMFDVGKLKINKAGEMYSKLRKSKGTFMFEREVVAGGWIGKFMSVCEERKEE